MWSMARKEFLAHQIQHSIDQESDTRYEAVIVLSRHSFLIEKPVEHRCGVFKSLKAHVIKLLNRTAVLLGSENTAGVNENGVATFAATNDAERMRGDFAPFLKCLELENLVGNTPTTASANPTSSRWLHVLVHMLLQRFKLFFCQFGSKLQQLFLYRFHKNFLSLFPLGRSPSTLAASTGQKEKGRELNATALRLWKSPSRMNAKPRPIGRELDRVRERKFPDLRATAAEATQICFVFQSISSVIPFIVEN